MALTDLIAPPALGFQPRQIMFGDQAARLLVILDYPPRVGPAWLSRLCNMPGVVASIHLVPTEPLDMLKALNKSIQEYTSRLAAGGNALALSRWQQSLDDVKLLLKKVDQEAQKVYRVAVVILVLAPDEEELARRSRQVEAACAAVGMRARTAVYRQEDALKAAGPWALLPPDIEVLGGREMPAETIAAAYPWVASGLNHGRGVVWARDADGGLVLVDRWDPPEGSGLTNPNINILGTSGGGKSYASKVLLLREYALGARILILDPEREYRRICRALGGAWINAAGGSGRINPLQVRPVPDPAVDDEDDETDMHEGFTVRGPLSAHLQRVKTFFQLYLPGLDDLERARLDEAVLASYRDYGVDWHTDPASVNTWPTVADVYRHVKAAGAERLAVLLKGAAEGADSALWAGQTTIPPVGDFTVLDIRDLTDASDTVRRAQYFNILGYAWDVVREGQATGKRTVLVVDEAWLLADPQTPQALGFLRDLSKRIRKYLGSLVVITQNVVDFLAPELARLGQPVVTNASSKLLMRQESRDLEALRELLRLSDAEVDLLAGAKRGEGLLLAGNQRVRVRIEAAPHEAEVIG
ncbi:conjugal transfer protein TraC [Clostridiales bacterium PH28_bin88]|nr:conjugal transfer protein TraC [Clostridiales bacterium PH28_bin88]